MSDHHQSTPVTQAYPSPRLEALEQNLLEHVAFLPRQLDKKNVDETSGFVRVDARLASDTFNKVLHARLKESDAGERIDAAVDYFHERDRPFTWWVGPGSRPMDIEARLGARGLQPIEMELGMTLELNRLPNSVEIPAGYSIRRASELKELEQFAALLSNLTAPADDAVVAFFEKASPHLLTDACPMQLFVAYAGDEPAATVELMLSPYAGNPTGFAGIHMSATADSHRRKGLGLAMSWTALHHARELGATLAGTLAGRESQALFTRLGFQASCRFVEYQP